MTLLNHIFIVLLSVVFLGSCATLPKSTPDDIPRSPDYNEMDNWAAHPGKTDQADRVPGEELPADQSEKVADVFFIHPTTYTGKPINNRWNAPIDDIKLNEKTDNSTIQYQASMFNQAGRVFAPRYRQAHIKTYYNANRATAQKVFHLAYTDVKNAFLHYLKFENKGRPFIIASHSQGTTHSVRLIKEIIDNQQLESKMIAAYLIGMPVPKNVFESIQPCSSENDLHCFVSWRTFKKGHVPKDIAMGDTITVHNPLSWTMDETYIEKDKNKGAIIRNFDKVIDKATDAQVHNGILWAAKPKFALSFLFTRKNFHIADLNFFYMNVRDNAAWRVQRFTRLK